MMGCSKENQNRKILALRGPGQLIHPTAARCSWTSENRPVVAYTRALHGCFGENWSKKWSHMPNGTNRLVAACSASRGAGEPFENFGEPWHSNFFASFLAQGRPENKKLKQNPRGCRVLQNPIYLWFILILHLGELNLLPEVEPQSLQLGHKKRRCTICVPCQQTSGMSFNSLALLCKISTFSTVVAKQCKMHRGICHQCLLPGQ